MKLQVLISSLICWASDGFSSNSSESSHNYTKNEMYLKLFDDTGYPAPGDIPLLNRKVFRGRRVHIREHSYIVSVRRRVSHYCMGTLVKENTVLSVAHPLVDVPINELSVVAGENYADRGTMLLTVLLLIVHEDFDRYTMANDIALLRIYENLINGESIMPIRLISSKKLLAGRRAFVTGWGRCDRTGQEICLPRTSRYYPGEKLDPMLRTISFIINEPNYYCEGYNRNDVKMAFGTVCLGTAREEDPMCPCLAVPGAPLVVGARLAALQSWGFGCGYFNDMPLVYTSLNHFKPWIYHNLQILQNITKTNLMKLFLVTKATILHEWLQHTRLIMLTHNTYPDSDIEPLKVDHELAQLNGSVYDVRDYLFRGAYYTSKARLYKDLKKKHETHEKIVLLGKTSFSVHPFLNIDDSYVVEAFNDSSKNDSDYVFTNSLDDTFVKQTSDGLNGRY